jgi:hypothetical protein
VRCVCHVLDLVARDGMNVIAGTIEKIKSLVLVVKGSPLQWEELMKAAMECGFVTSRGIHQDVSTRWNSTYMMLSDVLYYHDAFESLKAGDRRRYEKIFPSADEWAMAKIINQCLEIFYKLTTLLSGTSYPMENLFYRGLWYFNAASHKGNKLTIKIDFNCNYRIFTCTDFVCVGAFQIPHLFHPFLYTWRFSMLYLISRMK